MSNKITTSRTTKKKKTLKESFTLKESSQLYFIENSLNQDFHQIKGSEKHKNIAILQNFTHIYKRKKSIEINLDQYV